MGPANLSNALQAFEQTTRWNSIKFFEPLYVYTSVCSHGEREFPFTDEMLECETGSLLGRVADLERQSLAQRDELVCLRATLADALRRIAQLEGREKREDDRNERRNERMVSSPLRNGHAPLRSEYTRTSSLPWAFCDELCRMAKLLLLTDESYRVHNNYCRNS